MFAIVGAAIVLDEHPLNKKNVYVVENHPPALAFYPHNDGSETGIAGLTSLKDLIRTSMIPTATLIATC